MAKLYPPSIEGKLPAFAGSTLKIPLTMSRAVNMSEVSGMRAMIKTVQTANLKATLSGSLSYEATTGKYYAIFDLRTFTPTLGQFYKIQIAYVNRQGEIGYYSSVGVAKYTSYPSVTIPALTNNFYGGYEYTGVYSQDDAREQYIDEKGNIAYRVTLARDGTEKIYSYCFELTDTDGKIIATSGVQLHNSANDTASTTTTSDTWLNKRELERNKPYYLTYKVTTMNGLEVSSQRYTLMDQDSVDANLPVALVGELNYDDGCVGLYFYPLSDKAGEDVLINGSFVLARSSSLDNFTSWDEVYRFSYSNVNFLGNTSLLLWEDFTVQQGVQYKYALQAYNSYGLYSNRILNVNNIHDRMPVNISVDFEDAFLYDGERQLKIRFNPSISSFKSTVLESKMETIGSKFPFIFRNGSVEYKEFPVGGLISMISDPNERFLEGIQSENLYPFRKTTGSMDEPAGLDTALNANNIHRERLFKMQALEWLNNGKPKMFRSPTEGNFIVRLMNVSMSPQETLGRMLHSFSATAYEIAECNFANLISLGLIVMPMSDTTSLKVGQVSLGGVAVADDETRKTRYPDFTYTPLTQTIGVPSAFQANITEATPGTVFGLNFANGQETVSIEIGGTGAYYVLIKDQPLVSITLMRGTWDGAKLTFSYYDDTPTDTFSQVARLEMSDEIRQFIGAGFKTNIIESMKIKDIRRELGTFHYIKVMKRQVEPIWRTPNGQYSRNQYMTDIIKDSEWNPTVIYQVINENKYFNGNKNSLMTAPPEFLFALNPKDANDYMDFGGRENDSLDGVKWGDTFGRIDAIRNVEEVRELRIGSGLIVDIAYRVRTKEYVVETTDAATANAKAVWENALARVNSLIASPNMTQAEFDRQVKNSETAYSQFITVLTGALNYKQ